ncbi:MAG TPA: outer membrane beta-barrel protein [Alloacidobacterium sp.]|nr:outer membrane beta-barrel protein [Alloacidobacterium sp.]
MRAKWKSALCAATAAICFLVGLSGSAQSVTETVTDEPSSSPGIPDAPSTKQRNFAERWAKFYTDDWSGQSTGSSDSAPQKRGLPAPLDSPPFPNSDWSYGGSQDIGAPDGNVYPLMKALNHEKSRTKVYGWIEPGLNFSTSSKNNFPDSYTVFPNRLELDQAVIYIERLADTVQTKHFDWGYHITAFYGTDYRFTTAKGYFSQQLLLFNRQYGFDPVMEYVDLYFPRVAQGMDVRMGRFISVPGIEAQLAPNNYMFTHSLLYTIDPFTDTGIMSTIKLNKRWLVQAGFSAGHDVAPWTPDRKPTVHFCLNYTTASGNDNLYGCANGINDGKYAYNNLQHYDLTWYHKFNKSWHTATEAWYMYERDVPNVAGNVENPVPTEIGANGAFCQPGQLRCTAPEYAIVNYLQKEFNPRLFLSFRSDFLDDKKGQRTGYATKYSENTLMFGKWMGNTILIRPEIRFDRSWDLKAYNNGKNNNQFTFAADLIYKF